MRRLPKMAAALLAAALAVSAALPALAADQRAELELEASVRCTGEAADETLTVRLTALDGAPMPEGCDDEAELDFPARDCRDADDKTLTKTFDTIVYTAPGIYEYTVNQDAGGRKRADYDDTVFYLKVMVAWDTDGELKGHVSVRRDGDDGAKTELLFRNSYRSTDPLPPPVTPPYVPDKPYFPAESSHPVYFLHQGGRSFPHYLCYRLCFRNLPYVLLLYRIFGLRSYFKRYLLHEHEFQLTWL